TLDTAIVPLIERLNALEGVVSTSSCAGRVSVFLEGRKKVEIEGRGGRRDGHCQEGGDGDQVEEEVGHHDGEVVNGEGGGGRVGEKRSVPGGKGLGGRWLFVSHGRIEMPEDADARGRDRYEEGGGLTKLFGLTRPVTFKSNENGRGRRSSDAKNARFVRFAFEPMILHIATASLSHAVPILSAAISAGFRESGVQSLKNLTYPNAIPMVAVRSAGLAFESVIGVVRGRSVLPPGTLRSDEDGQRQGEDIIEALVSEEYLEMLVGIANERFEANTERIRRFEAVVFGGMEKKILNDWEDKQTRQERKKAEGLKRREDMKANHNLRDSVDGDNDDPDVELGPFEGIT
ncbi:MAG: hypothetical protein L6R38_001099, partial [Xanthoria sp. 2 TBL-2021]